MTQTFLQPVGSTLKPDATETSCEATSANSLLTPSFVSQFFFRRFYALSLTLAAQEWKPRSVVGGNDQPPWEAAVIILRKTASLMGQKVKH